MTPFPVEPERARGPMRFVLSSYPTREAAQAAAKAALSYRLAACASLLAQESRYWWRGRLESADEWLVVFKTAPKRVGALFRYLKEAHPYEVPEIAEVDVPRVDPAYLAYLTATVDPSSGPHAGASGLTRRGGPRGRGVRHPGRTRAPPRPPSRRTGTHR